MNKTFAGEPIVYLCTPITWRVSAKSGISTDFGFQDSNMNWRMHVRIVHLWKIYDKCGAFRGLIGPTQLILLLGMPIRGRQIILKPLWTYFPFNFSFSFSHVWTHHHDRYRLRGVVVSGRRWRSWDSGGTRSSRWNVEIKVLYQTVSWDDSIGDEIQTGPLLAIPRSIE